VAKQEDLGPATRINPPISRGGRTLRPNRERGEFTLTTHKGDQKKCETNTRSDPGQCMKARRAFTLVKDQIFETHAEIRDSGRGKSIGGRGKNGGPG